ncbi:MAG: hypothetical protein CMB11_00220 [Euryarchaeota archaeon]|nr:hypothetical protein [Euryarchaeota archaeon]
MLHHLVPLLETLGPLVGHPGLMGEHALDSIGNYIDESKFDECRARLVSGEGMQVIHKVRKYDVLFCDTADALPPAQRRQCVAVRGTTEVARRLDPDERGSTEIVVTFPGGGTLAVRRQHQNPRHLVVLLTSVKKKKRVLEADLPDAEAAQLATLFEEASRGERQPMPPPRTTSRFVSLVKNSYWELPPWYAEAVAKLAQDVFRLHAFVSSTSLSLSRALFIDRATAHRMDSGAPSTHRTLVKGILHRWSGGCACRLHRSKAPAEEFQRLEVRLEFCGGCIADGRCARHWSTEGNLPQSGRFPGICMKGLKVELRCTHAHVQGALGGLRVPLNVEDDKMGIAFAKGFVVDVAACGARLMGAGADQKELALDMSASLATLSDARLRHNHMGEHMMQYDRTAVHLLRKRSAIHKNGKLAGRVSAECSAILKTHKHLFRVKS